jgi:hypothetical protein
MVRAWSLLAVLVLAAHPARAQTLGSSGQYEGNNGVKLGEARAHPYFDLELRYDSAAGFFDTAGVTQLKSEAILHVRPGLRLDLNNPSVWLNLDANVDYLWYTGLITPGSNAASRLQAAADLSANFNRGGAVELALTDHFTRSDRTHALALAVGVLSIYNEALASLPLRPGGRALEIAPNVGFSFENFKSMSAVAVPNCTDINCDPTQVGQFNYQNLRLGLDGRWRFLPKTAVTLNTQYDSRSYANGANNLPASLIRASLGLAGLVSTKVAVVLRAGWGQDLKTSGAKTVLAQAELNYIASELSNFKLGYLRTLEPVPAFGINGDDRGYAETRLLLNGRLSFHGYAAFDYLTFYGPSGGRKDTNVTLDLSPEYQIAKWLISAIGYRLGVRSSSNSTAPSLNFTRHEAYARITLAY